MKWMLALLLSVGLLSAAENEIIVCENGTEMLAWDLDFVRSAEKSIEISACFFGGDVLQDLLHTIEARMEERPELIVHILTTPILMEERDEALIVYLEQKFPQRFHLVHAYNVMTIDPAVGSIDNHMKLFVVDEKYYSMGGSNLDDIAISEGTTDIDEAPHCKKVPVALPSGSRDQDLVGKGEMAKELRVLFFKVYAIWERFGRESILSELDPDRFPSKWFSVDADPFVERFEDAKRIPLERDEFKIVMGGPHQSPNAITNEYVKLISQAKKEVLIANLYFVPAKPIFDLIQRAAVPFKIVTNGVRESSPKCNNMYCWAHRVNYVPAMYGRTYHFWQKSKCESDSLNPVEIFEYDVKNVVLHKKAMVIDDDVAVIGSYNLGLKSDQCDYELIAVIKSKEAAAALKKVFKRDFEHAAKISPQEARKWYFDLHTAYLGELQKDFNGFI